MFHAGLAEAAKCMTEFRLLNNGIPITIGGSNSNNGYERLLQLLNDSPNGDTPLCRHVNDVVSKITPLAPSLRATGKKVKVIIATDGEASDGNLADAMRPLKNLPVWIVVRLCTSVSSINNYWAEIDAELELNMDVIQNHRSEAKEIRGFNPWLNYTEPLHRLREGAVTFREADLLDETKLTTEQIHRFCIFM